MHLLEKLTILWEWSIGLWVFVGDKFWGGAVGWYDKNICLMGKLICAVVTQIFLNWIMYWDITLNVFKVNYIENDKIQVFLWKMRLWETISTRSSEKYKIVLIAKETIFYTIPGNSVIFLAIFEIL